MGEWGIFFVPDADVRYRNSPRISYFQRYYPSRGRRRQNTFSKYLVDLKRKRSHAIDYFAERLDEVLDGGFAIAVVPSSDPDRIDSGIRRVARRILQIGDWTDATGCLVRCRRIASAHRGGQRDRNVHYQSIDTASEYVLEDSDVLLLDDVTTTGESLRACRDLLLERCGVRIVKLMAMGKTAGY